MISPRTLRTQQSSSRADWKNATLEKLKNASYLLLPSTVLIGFFLVVYPTISRIAQAFGLIKPTTKIKGTIPNTSHYSQRVKNKSYVNMVSIEAYSTSLIEGKRMQNTAFFTGSLELVSLQLLSLSFTVVQES